MKILVLFFVLATVEQCCGQDISFKDLDRKEILKQFLRGQFLDQKASCTCAKLSCSCCHHVSITKIGLDANVCFSGAYHPKELGISWTVTVNGKTFIHGKVSGKNPPLVCAEIPGLKSMAKLCIGFSDLKIQNHTFSGCVYLEAKLGLVVVTKYRLGCIKLPPQSSGQLPSIKPQSDLDQWSGQPLKLRVTSHQEKTMTTEEETILLTRMRIMAKKSTK